MQKKKNIFIATFFVLVFIYILRGIFSPGLEFETLHRGTMEDMLNTTALLIKYESLYQAEAVGELNANVSDGDRVSVGDEIAVLYQGEIDEDSKVKLEQINKKIEQITKSQASIHSFTDDVSKIESQIKTKVDELVIKASDGDLAAINLLKYDIELLADKKSQVSGKKSAATNTLSELNAQKQEIENRIGSGQQKIYAKAAGVFTSYIDGFETVITPYNMNELTPTSLLELIEKDKNAAKDKKNSTTEPYLLKIINNYRYFLAISAESEKLSSLSVGDTVSLRFTDLSSSAIRATIFQITEPVDNQSVVLIETDRYIESLLKKRTVNVDFIKHRFDGFKVSIKGIRTKDSQNGVYVKRDNILRFIPIKILYNTQEFALIQAADESKPIKLYDEVLVSDNAEFKEGVLLN